MNFGIKRSGSIFAALAFCVLLQVFAGHQTDYIQTLLTLSGVYVTLAVSLNLINGITGQFSIGHAAFFQIGAYTAGVLAMNVHPSINSMNWYLLISLVLGAAMAALAGVVVGLPSLRLRGDYLAIVTMGFGEIVGIIAKNQKSLGESYGMTVAPPIKAIWLVWLLAIVCIATCRNLLKNVHGLAFLAIREDEVAASAMGVNATRVKMTAFVIGSAFAGAAGALYAHALGFISPTNFSMDVSFIILTMVVLGGTGSITGSALSAIVLFNIPEKVRDLKDVSVGSLVAAGVVIIVAVGLIKWLTENYHGSKQKRASFILLTVVGGLVLFFVARGPLGTIPSLSTIVEGSKLRLVVFAVTLVVLMLLRPQGVFAHHEFSWAWVRSVLISVGIMKPKAVSDGGA